MTGLYAPRLPLCVGLISLVILIGGFGVWSAFAPLAGAVMSSGQIVIDQNRQIIQHPDGGVVGAVEVEEGDRVHAGDVLVRLDPTMLSRQLAIIESQLFELIARRGRLEAERDGRVSIAFDPLLQSVAQERLNIRDLMAGQERLMQARRETRDREVETLRKRQAQIGEQISGFELQEEAVSRQVELISVELASQQVLYNRGLAQASRILALRREEVRLSGALGQLEADRARAGGVHSEIGIELLKLEAKLRETAISDLRDVHFRELELREQRLALEERIRRLDIVAPVSGMVYGLNLHAPRAVLRPAQTVMFIVPQDRPLVVHARVDPADVDQVFLGQEVMLRFSTLDQAMTPELRGRLTGISADIFQDEVTGVSYYHAEVDLAPDERDRLDPDVELRPGMPVEVFMRTEDRTPLAYLTKPLTDYFARAFRG